MSRGAGFCGRNFGAIDGEVLACVLLTGHAGPHRALPEPAPKTPGSSSSGPGEAAPAAGGSAPLAPFLEEDGLGDTRACEDADGKALELIRLAVKPGGLFRVLALHAENGEHVRVRWRTMPCADLIKLADLLYELAPRHAYYLADLIHASHARPARPEKQELTS